MPLGSIFHSLSNRHPHPSERDGRLKSTHDEVSFVGMCIDTKKVHAKRKRTSLNHSSPSLQQDNKSYIVPKLLEGRFAAGALRMLLWDLVDDEIFTDSRKSWSGRYCIWYVPEDGHCFLTKLADGGLGYVNVPNPEEADSKFWFWPEMRAIRDKLVAEFGDKSV